MQYPSVFKNISRTKFIFALWLVATQGLSEVNEVPTEKVVTIKGEVTTVGKPQDRSTLVTGGPEKKATPLCKGGKFFEITQVGGTVITALGHPRIEGKEHCFFAASYTIDEISVGRRAIVGKLKAIETNKFVIVESSGKVWVLSKLPPGLKDSINKDVVTELMSTTTPDSESRWLVVRAFDLPTP